MRTFNAPLHAETLRRRRKFGAWDLRPKMGHAEPPRRARRRSGALGGRRAAGGNAAEAAPLRDERGFRLQWRLAGAAAARPGRRADGGDAGQRPRRADLAAASRRLRPARWSGDRPRRGARVPFHAVGAGLRPLWPLRRRGEVLGRRPVRRDRHRRGRAARGRSRRRRRVLRRRDGACASTATSRRCNYRRRPARASGCGSPTPRPT